MCELILSWTTRIYSLARLAVDRFAALAPDFLAIAGKERFGRISCLLSNPKRAKLGRLGTVLLLYLLGKSNRPHTLGKPENRETTNIQRADYSSYITLVAS
jgi:hypothetical protein